MRGTLVSLLCGVGSAEFSGLSVNSDSSSSLSSSVWFAVHNDIVMTHNLIMTSCQRIEYPLMLRQSMMNLPWIKNKERILWNFVSMLGLFEYWISIHYYKESFYAASHNYFNSFSVVIIRIWYVASCLLNSRYKTQTLFFNFFSMTCSNIESTGILLFQI